MSSRQNDLCIHIALPCTRRCLNTARCLTLPRSNCPLPCWILLVRFFPLFLPIFCFLWPKYCSRGLASPSKKIDSFPLGRDFSIFVTSSQTGGLNWISALTHTFKSYERDRGSIGSDSWIRHCPHFSQLCVCYCFSSSLSMIHSAIFPFFSSFLCGSPILLPSLPAMISFFFCYSILWRANQLGSIRFQFH